MEEELGKIGGRRVHRRVAYRFGGTAGSTILSFLANFCGRANLFEKK